MARADRLVRIGLDAERDAEEHAPDAGRRRALGLALCVERDRRSGRGCRAQLVIRLRVAVQHDPRAVQPRRQRERELTRGGDVRAETLLREQSEHLDVGKCLRPVHDRRVGNSRTNFPRPRPQGVLAVDDERCPEALRELAGAHAGDPELSLLDRRRVREELEHPGDLACYDSTPMQQLLT